MKSETHELGYQPSAELLSAIADVDQKLELRRNVDEAIEKKQAEIKAAEAEYALAMDKAGQAEAELALATDSEEVRNLEKVADRAVKLAEAARFELERKRRALDALHQRAHGADAEIETAKGLLNTEQSILATEAVEQYRAELKSSIHALQTTLKHGHALATALQIRALAYFVNAVRIPDPADPSGFVYLVDERSGIDWMTNETAAAIFEAFQPLRDVASRLAAHKPFSELNEQPRPYIRRGFTMRGRAADEAPIGQEAPVAQAVPATTKPFQRQELNVGAALMEDRAPHQLTGRESGGTY